MTKLAEERRQRVPIQMDSSYVNAMEEGLKVY